MLEQKRENLLIVCAGDNSLHPSWIPESRSFDVITIYYGSNAEAAEKYKKVSDLYFESKGLKIALAREVLFQKLYIDEQFDFSRYRHVWFPDDDLEFGTEGQGIEKLFEVAAAANADVFQPAIQNENYSRMWEPTRLSPGAFAHRTNIVEVMAHGFSGQVFANCYLGAIHVCEFMKSGWGIEPIWMKIGEALFRRPLRTYVFDCVPVIHTRPVGSGDSVVHQLGNYEATYIPQIHTNRMVTLRTYASLEELEGDHDSGLLQDRERVEEYHNRRFQEYLRRKRGILPWPGFIRKLWE